MKHRSISSPTRQLNRSWIRGRGVLTNLQQSKTRDGTVLRADVYRPAQEGTYPVLVQRTPYNKEFWPFTFPLLDPLRAAEAGYVVAIQDVRARWASDGEEFFLY